MPQLTRFNPSIVRGARSSESPPLAATMAAFSPSAFYNDNSEAFSESEDDFSEEDNYVDPSDNEESDSTEASEEEDDDAGDMGAVDRADHYCASYAFSRKSMKWWRK